MRKLPQELPDHGLLSPSGRISKRARDAALKREGERLFGPGGINAYLHEASEEAHQAMQPTEREALLQQAGRLRDLANRGMHPRKYKREAERLEQEAANIEQAADGIVREFDAYMGIE